MFALLYAARSPNNKGGSEQIIVVGGEVKVEISCGKDPRICEHVAQQTTWVSACWFRPERF
jgi:hypothetical protein